MATFSEAFALTTGKCFAEEGKNVQKWSEKHKLVAFLSFCFRILASEKNFGFFISKESLVATFSEKHAYTFRKYLTEQSKSIVNDWKFINLFACAPMHLF